MVHASTLQKAATLEERVRKIVASHGDPNTIQTKDVLAILERAETPGSRSQVSKHLNVIRRETAAEASGDAEAQSDTPEDTPGTEGETEAAPAADASEDAKRIRIWPLYFLMLPAFIAVWSGWVGIGEMTGFGEVNLLPGIADAKINTAITLPIGMEAYAAYALYIWLSGKAAAKALQFAKVSAIAALAVGGSGQIAYHVMEAAGVTSAPWWITAGVSCIPVAVVGMAAALAHIANSEA